MSFEKNGITFKGSDIDRKFSHANLKKTLSANLNEAWEKMKDEILPSAKPRTETTITSATSPIIPSPKPPKPSEQTMETPKVQVQKPAEPPRSAQPSIPPARYLRTIHGAVITEEQWDTLQSGGHIFVENMEHPSVGRLSSYVFLNDDKDRVFYSVDNPDRFVKYGKYEMRLRDKLQVEQGYITRATVKWWGGGTARPYLWKETPTDTDYKESFYDPRMSKEEIEKEKRERENRYRRTIPPPKRGPKIRR